ncbi:hypothetical protein V8G54_013808, partial [Vigna mungo]
MLHLLQVHGPPHLSHGLHVHCITVPLADHGDNANDTAGLGTRVVEEAEVADGHGFEIFLGLLVLYPIPIAYASVRRLVLPRPLRRFRFQKIPLLLLFLFLFLLLFLSLSHLSLLTFSPKSL